MVQVPSDGSELRIQPVDVGGGLARALQHDAGLAGHGVGDRIDLADAVEAVEREHDLAVLRDLSADQAGIAALRHDRRARSRSRACRIAATSRDRARPQHQRRVAAIQVAHLDQIGRLRLRIGDGVFLADDRGEAGEQIGGEGFGGDLTMFMRCTIIGSGTTIARRQPWS